jgi:hypothetical protein
MVLEYVSTRIVQVALCVILLMAYQTFDAVLWGWIPSYQHAPAEADSTYSRNLELFNRHSDKALRLLYAGHVQEAQPFLDKIATLYDRAVAPRVDVLFFTGYVEGQRDFVRALCETGQCEQCPLLLERALAVYAKTQHAGSYPVDLWRDLAECLLSLQRPKEALIPVEQLVDARRRFPPTDAVDALSAALLLRGRVHSHIDSPRSARAAETSFEECVNVLVPSNVSADSVRCLRECVEGLSIARQRQERYSDALMAFSAPLASLRTHVSVSVQQSEEHVLAVVALQRARTQLEAHIDAQLRVSRTQCHFHSLAQTMSACSWSVLALHNRHGEEEVWTEYSK